MDSGYYPQYQESHAAMQITELREYSLHDEDSSYPWKRWIRSDRIICSGVLHRSFGSRRRKIRFLEIVQQSSYLRRIDLPQTKWEDDIFPTIGLPITLWKYTIEHITSFACTYLSTPDSYPSTKTVEQIKEFPRRTEKELFYLSFQRTCL